MNIKPEVDVVVPRFYQHDKQRTSWRVYSYHQHQPQHPRDVGVNHPPNNSTPVKGSSISKKEEETIIGHNHNSHLRQQQQQRHHHVPPPCFSPVPSTTTTPVVITLSQSTNGKDDGLLCDSNIKTVSSPSPASQQQQQQQTQSHVMSTPQFENVNSRPYQDQPVSDVNVTNNHHPSVSSPYDGSASRMTAIRKDTTRKNDYSSLAAVYVPPPPVVSFGGHIQQQSSSLMMMTPPSPLPTTSSSVSLSSSSSNEQAFVVDSEPDTDIKGDTTTIVNSTRRTDEGEDLSTTEARLTRANILIQASYDLVWDSAGRKPPPASSTTSSSSSSSSLANQEHLGVNDNSKDGPDRAAKAVSLLQEALTLQRQCLGRYHKDVGWTCNFIGTAYWRLGTEPNKAIRYYIESRRIFCRLGLSQVRGIDQRINCILCTQLDYTPPQAGQCLDTLERAIQYELKGDSWKQEGELGMAQEAYQKARDLLATIVNHRHQNEILSE